MLAKKPKGATQKKRGSGVASLIWMFVGAILTLMIGLFLYLWSPFDMGAKNSTPERDTVKPIEQNNNEDGDYEFYDLLPEQEIITIPDESANVERFPEGDDDIQPDVVVNVPQSENADDSNNPDASNNGGDGSNANNGSANNSSNYGISEETILNPLQSQDNQTATNNGASSNDEMVIVEENGTYDAPSNRSVTQDANTNSNNNSNNNSNSNSNSNSNNNTQTNNNNAAPTTSTAANANRQNNSSQVSGSGAATITATNPKKTYILQINSFSNAEEADKRRAQVLMAGVDAIVVRNKMKNGQTFYQVVSTKMTNRQQVMLAQQKLQNNGIDSLIVEQRY